MVHKCDECPKEFKKKVSLLRHKERNECNKYNNLAFDCSECNKRYAFKKTLVKHMKDKHNKKEFKKENVNKIDFSKNDTDNKFVCHACNKTFSTKGNAKRHITQRRCPKLKDSEKKASVINNTTNNNTTNNINDNSINDSYNTYNIQINNFNEEKLDDWIKSVSKEKIVECLRDLNGLPTNLLEAKHVISKKNRNIYLPSEEAKYKNSLVYSDGWKEMKTSLMLDKMLMNIADDIYDIITNDKKYKFRLSKKLKEELDKKITVIQNDEFLQGPVANMLLKNKEVLHDNYEKDIKL